MRRSSRSNTSRDEVRAHLEPLRAQGLRPIRLWMPDVRAPEFAAQAHAQSLAVACSAHAAADQAFIDAVSSLPDA